MADLLIFFVTIFGIVGTITYLWGAWSIFALIPTLVGFEVVLGVLIGLLLLFCATATAIATWACFDVWRD